MPVTPTYPGVYIEEIPSGVRTITGVATSITAFLGQAARGPTNTPVVINGYADFERIFGGLWIKSTLGYAVRDFYLNGGSQAIIVRLVHSGTDSPPNNASAAKVSLATASSPPAALSLQAASEGAWGSYLRARVDYDVSAEVAQRFGLTSADLFNLTVADTKVGIIEQFRNLTVKPSPRRVDRVLKDESALVIVPDPTALPPSIPSKQDDPSPAQIAAGQSVWEDDKSSPPKTFSIKATDGADGGPLNEDDFVGPGKADAKQGLYALAKADLFNLLCVPPYLASGDDWDVDSDLMGQAASYCEARRAMLLVDPPTKWKKKDDAKNGLADIGTTSKNAALYFPRLIERNPLHGNQLETFVPCGAVAGIMARTDTQRGVWKAPAGLDATFVGVSGLSVPLTNAENGELNPLGINCLRAMPAVGPVVWGARTRQGDDRLASEWKYVPVRRLALYIEESLYRGTQWVVFEPNDEPLWSQIRLNVGAFMQNLFRQGAFQGKTPQEAYFVKCDKESTTQNDINLGIVNIVVGFAPLKPAEFVIIKIQQMAGQIQT